MITYSRTVRIPASASVGIALTHLALAVPAFPGAEGYGKNTVGGRGGTVIQVTNLNNSGTGSFRAAVTASGARTVVFRVGGIINHTSEVTITNPYLTIAGQTAPGGGVLFAGEPIKIKASEVIVRNIRRRYAGSEHAVDGIALYSEQGSPVNNVIMDHCSVSWATDENIGVNGREAGVSNVTVQDCIIAEGLTKNNHSMGILLNGWGSWGYGPDYISMHRNLFSNNEARNPRIGDGMHVEVVNNVIYNWKAIAGAVDDDCQMHYIGNYFKAGPSTTNTGRIIDCVYVDIFPSIEFYLDGNIGPNRPDSTYPETALLSSVDSGVNLEDIVSPTPILSGAITTATSAADAVTYVLANAGAFPRDSVDQRQIDAYTNNTGALVYLSSDVGGLPSISGGTPPTDTDNDGMPDSWETAHGHNINVNDSAGDADSDGYTNLEEYLNSFFTVATNTAPTVALTAPADEASFTSPATVSLTATAADSDGTVSKVEFYNGTTKLGEDLAAPYAYSWNNVEAGNYTLKARAIDNLGAFTDSAPADIEVISASAILDDFEDGNASGWTASGPGTWSVVTDGTEVYKQSNNGVSTSRSVLDTSATWTNQSIEVDVKALSFSGSNRFFGVIARHVDASNYYYFILRSNNTIELKKLVNGTSSILASGSFTVGTGTWNSLKLEIIGTSLKAYINDELKLQATDSTYSSGNVGVCTYYTAAEFDNVVADPMSVADVTPPTVSIIDPTNATTVSDTIDVIATAADEVGVVGVQFKLDGNNLGAEDTSSPYAISWNTATASLGGHALTAVARDAADNSTTSSAVNITVAPASIVDDFEDGNSDGWTTSGPGTWSVVTDGTKVYRQSNDAVTSTRSVLDATSNWTDQSIEVDVKALSHSGSNRFFGVIARFMDASNYYYFILRSNNTIELKKIINGTSATLDSGSFTVSTGTWYTLRLEASGTSLKAYINGGLALEATDSTYASGEVGLVTFYTAAQFADVVADATP